MTAVEGFATAMLCLNAGLAFLVIWQSARIDALQDKDNHQ